jgi:hypothetical protein
VAETRGTQAGAAGVSRQPGRGGAVEPTGWVGWVVFAGVMMVLSGTFQAIEGLAAIFNDDYFLVGRNGLLVDVDYTAWGWTHLILGLIVVAAGFALMAGQTWARVVAIVLAGASAILHLAFLAAYPIWALTVILLDIIVIFAVAVHGRELRSEV